MELTDRVSAVIFALIVVAVVVFLTMARYVIGPTSRLTRAERIILSVSFVGVLAVMGYAAVELLFRVLF